MNKKVMVRKNNIGPDFYNSPWEVVDRVNPSNSVERQVFSVRSEARKYAAIRNTMPNFITAVREFVNS
jgi:hypothetical protein